MIVAPRSCGGLKGDDDSATRVFAARPRRIRTGRNGACVCPARIPLKNQGRIVRTAMRNVIRPAVSLSLSFLLMGSHRSTDADALLSPCRRFVLRSPPCTFPLPLRLGSPSSQQLSRCNATRRGAADHRHFCPPPLLLLYPRALFLIALLCTCLRPFLDRCRFTCHFADSIVSRIPHSCRRHARKQRYNVRGLFVALIGPALID